MPEETWPEPRTELGLCILCAQCRPDCLVSTQGWVCRGCWRKVAESPDPPTNCGRLAIVPPPDQYGYVVIDPQCIILTVQNVLYFFRCERHALDLRDRILPNEPGVSVVRVRAALPFLYVMNNPDLKMVFVRDVANTS